VNADGRIDIVSFGYLHAPAPAAHITLDLRSHFRDPHINPAMRELTALDEEVVDTVLGTPGIRDLIDATAAATRAFLAGPSTGPLTIAIGCAGGRHRSAAVARELGSILNATVTHRDLTQPVIDGHQCTPPTAGQTLATDHSQHGSAGAL
jgi:RNase adaptor protein for sRNA GlmZ degradation